MNELLSNKELFELINPKREPVILLFKYCLKHHKVTWHILCAAGTLKCLYCYLEDRINQPEED